MNKYAEPEVAQLDDLLSNTKISSLEFACVIPAYKETTQFVEKLVESHLTNKSILLIVVVNQPDYDENVLPQKELHQEITTMGNVISSSEHLTWLSLNNSLSAILLVNRFDSPIEEKYGVGQARKIGCDLALALYKKDYLKHRFIGSTDADATLPSDYFEQIKSLGKNNSFAVFNFSHQSIDKQIHQANHRYETALRYFVSGLAHAGSDYGHYTIGSLLVINLKDYAVARGFPKRSAGEDFYLLNKLAKTGSWTFFKQSVVRLEARPSDRVPFGTGPTVSKILGLADSDQDYCYYHPQLFEQLKSLLSQLDNLNGENYKTWSTSLDANILKALNLIGFEKFYSQNCHSSDRQFNKQLHNWFDNFKTLKFLHAVREVFSDYKDIPLEQAIQVAPFAIADSPVVDA